MSKYCAKARDSRICKDPWQARAEKAEADAKALQEAQLAVIDKCRELVDGTHTLGWESPENYDEKWDDAISQAVGFIDKYRAALDRLSAPSSKSARELASQAAMDLAITIRYMPTPDRFKLSSYEAAALIESSWARVRAECAGWISVKDRYPEDGQLVLFVVANDVDYYAGTVQAGRYRFEGGKYHTFSFPGRGTSASHWMPLPSPPAILAQPKEESHGQARAALALCDEEPTVSMDALRQLYNMAALNGPIPDNRDEIITLHMAEYGYKVV